MHVLFGHQDYSFDNSNYQNEFQGKPYSFIWYQEDSLEKSVYQNQFEGKTYQIVNNLDSTFGFGFWSQCVPQLISNINTNYYDNEKKILPNTQFLILIDNQQINMLVSVDFNEIQMTVQHRFKLFQINYEQELSFSFNPIEYEGQWLFTMIIFHQFEEQLIIQMTGHDSKTFNLIKNTLDLSVSIGGIYIQQDFIIDYFKGKFSKLIIEYDADMTENIFLQYAQNDLNWNKYSNEFQYLIADVIEQNFQSPRLQIQTFDQKGYWYAISGWVKHEIQLQPKIQIIELIKILSQQEILLQNEGSLIFSLLYQINQKNKNQSSIATSAEFHYLPYVIEDSQYAKRFVKILQVQTDDLFSGIQNWHFFQYEYIFSEGGKLQINFHGVLGTYSETIGDSFYNNSFINSLYYFYIGENIKTSNTFFGSLTQIKFFHYNGKNSFQNLNYGCHYQCEQCYGPFQNNCLSCKSVENRILLQEVHECQCSLGYIQVLNGECKLQFDIQTNQIIEDQLDQDYLCQFGYFYSPSSFEENNCLQCPQNNKGEFYCLECIFNPNSWYQNPYCQTFMQSRQQYFDDAFLINKEVSIHNFIIDENNLLISLPLFEIFCKQFKHCSYQNNLNLNAQINQQVEDFKEFQLYLQPYCSNISIMDSNCFKCQLMYISECFFSGFLTDFVVSDKIFCGSYCFKCTEKRCLNCVNDSEYYISSDGWNCRKNEIPHCLQAFQSLKNNYSQNTLLQDFQVFDSKDAVVLCARCKDNYAFILQIKQCLKLVDSNCLFAVAESLNQLNQQITGELTVNLDDTIVFTNRSQCLITFEYSDNSLQHIQNCYQKISNCVSCLKNNQQEWVCLECQKGYDLKRDTYHCDICNVYQINSTCPELNYNNIQYLNKISAFHQYLIGDFNFNQYIVFDIKKQRKACHHTCLECSIDLYVCLRCKANQKGRLLSLSSSLNQCIECPENCLVCSERTTEQIHQINPLFNNLNFSQYTSQCLKQDQKENLFYDKELGQFIQCFSGKICKKSLQIKLNLYCSQIEFSNQVQLLDASERQKFLNENILYQDLIKNQLPQYNQEFYLKANQESIRKISIIIYSQRALTCKSDFLNPIVNLFSQNIFSALEVSLELQFSDEMILDLPEKLVFENFSSVTLKGIKFVINNEQRRYFQTIFKSKFILSSIYLSYLSFQELYCDQKCFVFINAEIIQINNFNFSQMNMSDGTLFVSEPIQVKQDINFNLMLFSNTIFTNFSIIKYNSKGEINFKLEKNIIQDCILSDSFLMSQFQSIDSNYNKTTPLVSIITLNQLEIQSSQLLFSQKTQIYKNFFDLENFTQVQMVKISLIQSTISNTNLINLNQNSNIENFQVQLCILNNSQIIINQPKIKHEISFYFLNLSFQSNFYNTMSGFLNIQEFGSMNNQLDVRFLNISNNSNLKTENILQNNYINHSLIYFSLKNVYLEKLFIYKGEGATEIRLAKIQNLTISFIQIISDQSQSKQVFHEKSDCMQQNNNDFKPVLNMHSIAYLLIMDGSIVYTFQINSPLIYYKSSQLQSDRQNENIFFKRLQAHQNIMVLEKQDALIGIIKLETFQNSQITIEECNFNTNIMQEINGDLERQASLISIEAKISSIILSNSTFYNNAIINSFDSIINIKCKQLTIRNCTYLQNNLLTYDILQPLILWDFENPEKVFLDDIFNIFQIKSFSGNGVFEFDTIIMENITIQGSRASKGAGFLLIPLNQSNVHISEVFLYSIETTFTNLLSDCGIIIFDLSSSQNLILTIENIVASQIFLYNQCSLFKVINGFQDVDAYIRNIEAIDVFSQQASIISITFDNNPMKHNSIKICNVKYETTYIGWENFINQFLQNSLFQNEIIEISSNFFFNRTAFLIDNGKYILFENIVINSLIQESVFIFTNSLKLILKDILIQNLIINDKLIFVSQSLSQINSSSNILIQNLKISNLSQELFKVECKGYFLDKQHMQCSQKLEQAPQILLAREIFLQDYCKIWVENLTDSFSIIQFVQIKSQTKIHLNNLELTKAHCTSCFNGLFFIKLASNAIYLKLKINNFFVLQSICGKLSCFYVSKINNFDQKQQQQYNAQQWPQIIQQNEVLIQNYHCSNNKGLNGTCLNINDLKIVIRNSVFKNNKANYAGGALYFNNNNNFIFIENCYISENYAIFGGGIYIYNQFSIDYGKFHSFIQNNSAFYSGQNIYSAPIKLSFKYGGYEKNCQIDTIYFTNQQIQDQVSVSKNKKIFGVETEYLLFPNGQKINKYQYFDWQNRKYQHPNLNFRIIMLTDHDEKYIDVNNASCIIKSALKSKNSSLVIDQKNTIFTNNYTNFNSVYFNYETEDFNLDDLEIYFSNNEDVILIEFFCDPITIPLFNKNYPYNLISSHSNYSLRFLVTPLPCQLGEIKNPLKGCDVCNFEDGFFVLELNSNNCQVKDDISTVQVTSTQLLLRQGFWRPYFDTSIVSYCENLPFNCKGGWIEGDSSCLLGHIGALCEQCDLMNIRGDGQYYRTKSYDCSLCQNYAKNFYILTLFSIYVFISILLSISSNIESVDQQIKILKMKLLGFRVIFLYNEKSILLKLLTHYFQIIGSVYDVQKNILIVSNNFLNFTISPIQSMIPTIDCLVSNNFQFNAHYMTMIIQLIQPFCFITFVLLFFNFGYICDLNKISYQLLVSTTLIYIYIYFQPTLVGKLVQLIAFKRISGFKWILANVAYRYDDQNHYFWMEFFLLPAITILIILIPLYFLYGLYSNQKSLNNKIVRQKWGYLFCEYKNDAYLWEILRIIQKSIMIGFLNYYEDYPIIKAFIVVFILLIYLNLSDFFKPYTSSKLNKLDFKISLILAYQLVAQLFYQAEVQIIK